MRSKSVMRLLGLLVVAGLILSACGGPQAVQTVVVEGTPMVVTATAEPTEEPCDNPFVGSCELDGNGIPPDFFSDIHVRRAFNYCFDWDTFIEDAWNGEAVQSVGPLIPGMTGYDPDGPTYSYDPAKCEEEFKQAWDGQVWENGFRMQVAYNTGNITRQTTAQILQANLAEINENFVIEVVGLPWPAFLAAIRASQLPLYISGWIEDIHDPHNWAQPFLVGTYANRQNLPDDMVAEFEELVSAGVAAQSNAERAEIYQQITAMDYENSIAIRLAVPTNREYLQDWVEGYYFNPIHELRSRFYTLSKSSDAPDPETFTYALFGDADTFDPAWNYENFGDAVILNTYDQLVTYNGADATTFSPSLATSWEVSDDGTVYTFNIRDGVTFHEGQELTAEDVAYSLQRGVLQGGTFSPQWLFTEPFFGTGIYDIAEVVDPSGDLDDDPEALQAADSATLVDVCEQVTDAIVADEAAGTVTMTLSQAWSPFLATLAQSWGSILDKDWAIENGAWDGDCGTWQNYYGVTSETTPIRDVINGTGPYMLDHWTPGEEIVLVANEDYWRTEPAFEGGPTGAPSLKRVVYAEVDEWGTRFAMLQARDADWADVDRQFVDQVDPLVVETCRANMDEGGYTCEESNADGVLRLYMGDPETTRTDAMFVFEVAH